MQKSELEVYKAVIAYLEGYRSQPYLDDRGVITVGYGQTGKYMNMPFEDVIFEFEEKTRRITKGFDLYPMDVKAALVAATYRGSWSGSPKARRLLAEGNGELAAEEFLNNEEYRTRKAKGGDGVTERMEWVAHTLKRIT